MSPPPHDDAPVLVLDDALWTEAPAEAHTSSPGEYLRIWNAPGAYTTMRTYGRYQVCQLESHVRRLRRSLAALADATPEDFAGATVPGNDKEMWSVVEGALGLALRTCEERHVRGPNDALGAKPGGGETMLVVVVSPTGRGGWRVGVHASPLRTPAPDPVALAVMGLPRRVPVAKDARWPKQRAHLEAGKPAGVAEIILADDDGERLLEGLVTNLFVVIASDADPLATRVQTAPADECLPGLAREAVLDACAALGIEVEERAPRASERHVWREAFVSNTIRLVHPVREIRWPRGLPSDLARVGGEVSCEEIGGDGDREVVEGGEIVVRLPDAPGPVTAAILIRVTESLAG